MEKKLQHFSQQGLSFVCSWRSVYRSALVPRNLPCLEKFLVACLHEEIPLKFMSQTKENCDSLVLSRSYLWMVWRFREIPRVHRYYFCLEPTVRKDTWVRTTSVTVMAILFESSILKISYLTTAYIQSSFSRITSHVEKKILKDTLQLNNLRTWINIHTKYFIKTLVNIMKQKSMTVPRKNNLHKNPSVHFEEHYT